MAEGIEEPTLDRNGIPDCAETLCRWIRSKRLETPATLFLEIHRPLMPLAWPAAVLFGPFIAPFLGPGYYDQVEALRDPAVLDRLLARLSEKTGGATHP
jgi:hypothetical protein